MIYENRRSGPADAKLLKIQGSIYTLMGGNSRVYGLLPIEAITTEGAAKEKPKRLPKYLLDGQGRYEPVVPDEKKGGMVLFIQTADPRVKDWIPGQATSYTVELPVALLVWGKAHSVDFDADGLRRDIMQVLARCSDWNNTGFSTQLQARLFRELDYDFTNHRYLMHPFYGIRIDGVLTYNEKTCN